MDGPTLTLPVWRGRGSRDACSTRGVRWDFVKRVNNRLEVNGWTLTQGGSMMYCRCGHEVGCTTPPPSQGGMGWVLHATRRSKRSCNCRKDGDYDVEDFSPGAVVVEGSHSGKWIKD